MIGRQEEIAVLQTLEQADFMLPLSVIFLNMKKNQWLKTGFRLFCN
jgi:hypothetical protein